MSQARNVDGNCVEFSQRTMLGRFRFLQNAKVQQLILFALARACDMTGAQLVTLVFMSTHYHVIVQLQCPQDSATFVRELNSFVARGMNRLQGTVGQFWRNKRPQVTPVHANALYDRIRYILCNPLRAFIARTWRQHAGVVLGPDDIGREIIVECPMFAVGERTNEPAFRTLTLVNPVEQSGTTDDEEYVRRANQLIDEGEAVIRAEHQRAGKTPPTKSTMERRIREEWANEGWLKSHPDEDERELARRKAGGPPRYFAKGKEAVAREEKRQAEFQRLYRDAMRAWHEDDEAVVVFPHGTVKMAGMPRVLVSQERIVV